MPPSSHDAEKEPASDPYDVRSLKTDYQDFLKDICEGVVPRKVRDNPDYDDGGVFYAYVMNDINNEITANFRQYLTDNGVKYLGTFDKTKSAGIGNDKAELAFRLSAKYQERPLEGFLKDYVLFCKSKGHSPAAFEKHQDLVDEILGVTNVETQAQNPISIQDTVTLNAEIEALKEVVGFYPYQKDQIVSIDAQRLESTNKRVEQLLAISPDNTDLLCVKVDILARQKKLERALEVSIKLMTIEDQDRLNRCVHAACLGANGQMKEALALSLKTNDLHPNSVIVLLSIANCYSALGDSENAISFYKATIFQDKEFIKPYIAFSNHYRRLKKLHEAEAVVKRGLKVLPDNEALLLFLHRITVYSNPGRAFDFLMSLFERGKHLFNMSYVAEGVEIAKRDQLEGIEFMATKSSEVWNDPVASETEKNMSRAICGVCFCVLLMYDTSKRKYGQYALENLEVILGKFVARIDRQMIEFCALTHFLLRQYDEAKKYLDESYEIPIAGPEQPKPFWPYMQAFKTLADLNVNDFMLPLQWMVEKSPFVEGYAMLVRELVDREEHEKAVPFFEAGYELIERGEKNIIKGSDVLAYGAVKLYWRLHNHKFLDQAITIAETIHTEETKDQEFDIYMNLMKFKLWSLNLLGEENKNIELLHQVFQSVQMIVESELYVKNARSWADIKYQMFTAHFNLLKIEKKEADAIDAIKTIGEILTYTDFDSGYFEQSLNQLPKLSSFFIEGAKSKKCFEEYARILESALNRVDKTSHPNFWLVLTLENGQCYFKLGNLNNSEIQLKKAENFLKDFLTLSKTDITGERRAEISKMIEFCENNTGS